MPVEVNSPFEPRTILSVTLAREAKVPSGLKRQNQYNAATFLSPAEPQTPSLMPREAVLAVSITEPSGRNCCRETTVRMGAPVWQLVTLTLTLQTPSSSFLSCAGRIVCEAAKPRVRRMQILNIR